MASTVASLFGPSAEEIVFARRREDEQAAQQRYLTRLQQAGEGLGPFAWAARAGVDVGETLRTGLFGGKVEDPLINKYNRINAILAEEQIDLNDPASLKKIAQRLEQEGFMNEAVNLYDRATTLEYKEREMSVAEGKSEKFKLTSSFKDKNGRPVLVTESGRFKEAGPNGRELAPWEVMSDTEWNDTASRNLAIDRINKAQIEAQSGSNGEPTTVIDERVQTESGFSPIGVMGADKGAIVTWPQNRIAMELERRKVEERQQQEREKQKSRPGGGSAGIVEDPEGTMFRDPLWGAPAYDTTYVPPLNPNAEQRRTLTPIDPYYTMEQGLTTPGMLFDPRRRSQEDVTIPAWDIRLQNRM